MAPIQTTVIFSTFFLTCRSCLTRNDPFGPSRLQVSTQFISGQKAMTSFEHGDLLRLDSIQVQRLLSDRKLSIPELISKVSQQIKNENHDGLSLRALIASPPEELLQARARQLDDELLSGHSRGPLHGIPVVLKDCIATGPELGMITSAGSFALQQNIVLRNAPLVDRLLESGAIIVGKTNLSELCAFKGENLMDGFSPVGGQTVSPYIYGDIDLEEGDLSPSSPGGSSTGSAVSVSAGFALLGIGTENDGSIVQPSSRQALYSLKPSRGLISSDGLWRVSKTLDTPGAMARSARDLASVTAILLDSDARKGLPGGSYDSFLVNSMRGLRVGFVDPAEWRFPPDLWVPSEDAKQQHDTAYHGARALVARLGATVVYPVTLPRPSQLVKDGDYTPFIVNVFENAATAQEFFKSYVDPSSPIQSLADLVNFNCKHSKKCLPKNAPDQSWLVKAIKGLPSEDYYKAALQHMERVGGSEGVFKTLEEKSLDLIIAPMDSPVCSLSTASGCPIANVPLGRYRLEGALSRPFGLALLGGLGSEGSIFKFMSAYEAGSEARVIPERLAQPRKGH